MKLAPLDTLKGHLPFFHEDRAEKAEEPVKEGTPDEPPLFHTDPGPAVSEEAKHIEAVRHDLLEQSERVRLGVDPHPEETARALSRAALDLARSDAPAFEKAEALAETEANLHAGGAPTDIIEAIDQLAMDALGAVYSRPTDAQTYLDRLNDIEAHKAAIQLTTPDRSFPQALEQAKTEWGHPIDQLIVATGQVVADADQLQAEVENHIEAAKPATGAFDPFIEDEDDETAA